MTDLIQRIERYLRSIVGGNNKYSQSTDLLREALAALSHRSAWLIENGKTQGHGLKYQTFDPDSGMFTWTEDVYEALHFSRRKDAELIARESEDAWRIVEHVFASQKVEPNPL